MTPNLLTFRRFLNWSRLSSHQTLLFNSFVRLRSIISGHCGLSSLFSAHRQQSWYSPRGEITLENTKLEPTKPPAPSLPTHPVASFHLYCQAKSNKILNNHTKVVWKSFIPRTQPPLQYLERLKKLLKHVKVLKTFFVDIYTFVHPMDSCWDKESMSRCITRYNQLTPLTLQHSSSQSNVVTS